MIVIKHNVSLVTTVYQEEATIWSFLDSYRQQKVYADEFIVVDGGSTDQTVMLLGQFASEYPEFNLKVIVDVDCSRHKTAGPIARGRNRAIAETRYEIVAVTDAGCLLEPDWLAEMLAPFADSVVDVVSGWYEGIAENAFQQAYKNSFMPKLESIDRNEFLPSSRSLAFRKGCWEAVGGYPELTFTAEDTRFDLALKQQGYRFYFNEHAVVLWRIPNNLIDAIQKHYRYGVGDGQYRQFPKTYLRLLSYLFFPLISVVRMPFYQAMIRYLITFAHVAGYLRGYLKGVRRL